MFGPPIRVQNTNHRSCLSLDNYGATACNAMHGIAVAILSVSLSDACIVTKLNKGGLRIFLYHTIQQSL